MKKPRTAIVLGILLVGSVGYLSRISDEYIEVNAMTGSVRTRMRYSYVFNTPWKVRPTWAEESAARQGISTEEGWRYLAVVSKGPMSELNACGHAPASYPLNVVNPDALNLTSSEEIDHFVHDFIFADESKRKEMISNP